MPLAFESESHGTIAFGFFNIKSDLLILDKYFFFASDFCKTISQMVDLKAGDKSEFSLSGFVIEDPNNIGDLQGGIAGTNYSGFIGETYKKYPFPCAMVDFKQQTTGFETREDIEQIILDYGTHFEFIAYQRNINEQVKIGTYLFSEQVFLQLIEYVIQGGYPRWQDENAPEYVTKMQEKVALKLSLHGRLV